MRYREAYELIEAGLMAHDISFPVTEKLKSTFFDENIKQIAQRVVRNEASETFTTTKTKEFTFTNSDVTNSIYRVTYDDKLIPFVPEGSLGDNIDDDDVAQLGYYFKKDDRLSGSITAATSANPIAITSNGHELSTGDHVIISGIAGLLSSSTSSSEVNSVRHAVTSTGANTFTIPIDGSSYNVAYTSGGTWQKDDTKIMFNKNVDAGKTLKVYYYSLPTAKVDDTSRIDLPDQLIPAAIHYSVAHILALNGNLQLSSGHNGIALIIEKNYLDTDRSREAFPNLLNLPLQEFI